jgi:hypothetical protein
MKIENVDKRKMCEAAEMIDRYEPFLPTCWAWVFMCMCVVLFRFCTRRNTQSTPGSLCNNKNPNNEIGIARAADCMIFSPCTTDIGKGEELIKISLPNCFLMSNGLRSVSRSHTGGGGEASRRCGNIHRSG